MVKVARLYHEHGVRQPEIARRLHVSQARVSRLLKQAELEGIVRTTVVVPAGVQTALEEALFLTRFATKVTLIHRRYTLRASKIMQERARANTKIEFAWNSAVEEVLGDEFVTGLRLRDVKTEERRTLPVEALFVAIGHQPNTSLVKDQLNLDPVGYVKVEKGTTRTSVEGVFACGDAMDPVYRQAVTAAGTGCMAAIDAERWLAARGIE